MRAAHSLGIYLQQLCDFGDVALFIVKTLQD